MKILLVENNSEKARLVTSALLEVSGLSAEDIVCCSAAVDAKKWLKRSHFDLLILDMNIPARVDQHSKMVGGTEVARVLYERGDYNIPSNVIGLSAYAEGVAEAEKGFSNPLWKIVRYAADESDWKNTIQAAVRHIQKEWRYPPVNDGNTFHTTLGVVVGLEDVELESILRLDPSFAPVEVRHDPTRYFRGIISEGQRYVDVVVAAAPKMGLVNAAIVSTRLIETFRPKYLAMSGICAGVRDNTGLGDILVADPCFDWASGKIVTNKEGEEDFLSAPYPWRLDSSLRSIAKDLSRDQQWLDSVYLKWEGSRPDHKTEIKIEAVASGGSVLQRKATVDAIKLQHKNLIGVEMEAYAVFTAAALASLPRPTVIVAKSVCDFGDEHKSNNVQKFAAYTSAQFLKELALRCMAKERDEA